MLSSARFDKDKELLFLLLVGFFSSHFNLTGTAFTEFAGGTQYTDTRKKRNDEESKVLKYISRTDADMYVYSILFYDVCIHL